MHLYYVEHYSVVCVLFWYLLVSDEAFLCTGLEWQEQLWPWYLWENYTFALKDVSVGISDHPLVAIVEYSVYTSIKSEFMHSCDQIKHDIKQINNSNTQHTTAHQAFVLDYIGYWAWNYSGLTFLCFSAKVRSVAVSRRRYIELLFIPSVTPECTVLPTGPRSEGFPKVLSSPNWIQKVHYGSSWRVSFSAATVTALSVVTCRGWMRSL